MVGAGWISQIAFMPGIEQTGNSEMTAIVSGNRANAEKLATFYGIEHIFSYEQYDDMLRQGIVDAVYIALPNSMHADYAIRAAKAGVHALVEKPLAITVAECEAMIAAADKAGVFLMTAYRLHNEPGTIEVLETHPPRRDRRSAPVQFGVLLPRGARQSPPQGRALGWCLQDIGVYCMNAARHVFGTEPTEAVAMSGWGDGDPRFAEVEEMISATLRFPGDRLAQFIVSFGADDRDSYRVVGTKGQIEVDSAYRLDRPISLRITSGGKVTEKNFPQYDHFSGQAHYFSDCILKGIRPEPDGGDGANDVRALLAIEAASRTGQAQKIASPPRPSHPTPDMARSFPWVEKRLML